MLKHLNNRKYRRWTLLSLLSIVILFLVWPISKPLFNNDYSTVVRAENGSFLHVFINGKEQWHLPPDTMSVPERLKQAVITYEDEAFYRHPGVNLQAVFRAFKQNISQGEIVSGASTIPMQLARMARPKKRTYFNKFREMCMAVRLSIHFSKETLLKLYLEQAPYGGNVIGYRTASFKYYAKEATLLTWSEAATLAVLPNAPGLIYPSNTSTELKEKRDALLKKLLDKNIINEQSYKLALLEDVPQQFNVFESKLPHLARNLKNTYPGQWILETTIDEGIQVQCNLIAARYKDIYAFLGIHNLSILVADTKNGAVKAYVGSPDFFDQENGGQVDGVMAPRSSGSTLKPFLFALCIDEGMIIPESYIRDLPTYFDGFSPRNANREYQGVTTARDALIHSLNIPAVRLLNAYGIFDFYSFLQMAGVSTLFRTADDYGLPLIIGGAEVNMWDLVMLYRGLANNGVFSQNHVLIDESMSESPQMISAASCQMVLDVIKDLRRPGSEYYWQRFNGSRPLAWKTGTSYGHKDAWAVGLNPDYTIAVWVGNFDGEGNKNLSGAATAGPVLFDILQVLPSEDTRAWFEQDAGNYKRIEICALSGFRATEACPDVREIDVPAGMKPLAPCAYHQFRYFSADGRYQTCSRCWNLAGGERKSVPLYPPDIAYYLRERGVYVEELPGHYPDCPAYRSEDAIRIIYPNMDARLFLPRDFDGEIQAVVCKAGTSHATVRVFWYLDDLYLGSTINEHKMDVVFREGWNTLKVIDENGAEDSKRVLAAVKKNN